MVFQSHDPSLPGIILVSWGWGGGRLELDQIVILWWWSFLVIKKGSTAPSAFIDVDVGNIMFQPHDAFAPEIVAVSCFVVVVVVFFGEGIFVRELGCSVEGYPHRASWLPGLLNGEWDTIKILTQNLTVCF